MQFFDEVLDSEIIRALREKDANALQSVPRAQLNSGSSEIRNWICAAGALEHLDLRWVHYYPGYRTPAGTGGSAWSRASRYSTIFEYGRA